MIFVLESNEVDAGTREIRASDGAVSATATDPSRNETSKREVARALLFRHALPTRFLAADSQDESRRQRQIDSTRTIFSPLGQALLSGGQSRWA